MLVAGLTHSQPLYSSHEIRSIELATVSLSPTPALMEHAGKATAELAIQLLGNHYTVLVLAGPGNNGGDAMVAARYLRKQDYRVDVVLMGDPAKLPADAAAAFPSDAHRLAAICSRRDSNCKARFPVGNRASFVW